MASNKNDDLKENLKGLASNMKGIAQNTTDIAQQKLRDVQKSIDGIDTEAQSADAKGKATAFVGKNFSAKNPKRKRNLIIAGAAVLIVLVGAFNLFSGGGGDGRSGSGGGNQSRTESSQSNQGGSGQLPSGGSGENASQIANLKRGLGGNMDKDIYFGVSVLYREDGAYREAVHYAEMYLQSGGDSTGAMALISQMSNTTARDILTDIALDYFGNDVAFTTFVSQFR
jgi:hypothetical protein